MSTTTSSAITRLQPRELPDTSNVGYSQISVAHAGRLAFVSGQVAWLRDHDEVPQSLAEQCKIVVRNLRGALAALNAGPHAIVQMRIYMTDLQDDRQATVMGALAEFLDGAQPSLTGIGVAALATPALQVEVELVVQLPSDWEDERS